MYRFRGVWPNCPSKREPENIDGHEKITFCFGISCEGGKKKQGRQARNGDSRKEQAQIQNKRISPTGHPMLWICKWISCRSLGYSLDMPYMAGIASDLME